MTVNAGEDRVTSLETVHFISCFPEILICFPVSIAFCFPALAHLLHDPHPAPLQPQHQCHADFQGGW